MVVHQIYRFYAELRDYTTKIWRRFEVNGTKTIAELGYIIMTMFEMQGSHLFCFMYDQGAEVLEDMQKSYTDKELNSVLGKDYIADLLKPWRFELPSDEIIQNENEKWRDAGKYRLKDMTGNVPWKLAFEYDYGDGWQIDLTLESCEKAEISAVDLPKVLAGEGFGIIEDVGGVGGLKELAKAFKKKKGPQYDEYREWLGIDDIDLAAFNIEDINFRLKKLPRIFKESYEYGYEPTQRSIDLIERKYKK